MKKNQTFLRVALLFYLSLGLSSGVFAQLSGTVFRDFNGNGVRDISATINEPFVEGVLVTAFPTSGISQTAITDAGGFYSFAGLTFPVRLEFSGFGQDDVSTFFGSGSATSVQFYAAASSTANFGLNVPEDYCEENPKIVYPCYENGSGVGNVNPVMVQHDYRPAAVSEINEYYADGNASIVGSVYGVAYDRSGGFIYTSAFLKRQVGIGVRGYDGIYVFDNNSATPFLAGGIDMEGVVPANGGAPLAFGSVTRNLIASGAGTGTNDLSADRAQASRDADAYGKVGKVSYGDIDMDQATQTLWAVNLFERSLVAIDLSTSAHNTNQPNMMEGARVRRFFIDGATSPSITGLPTCSDGMMRPFALKIYRGRGYLGMVCDGSSLTQVDMTSNQSAYVLSFDLANPTSFTVEASLPLDYVRERSWVPFASTGFTALDSDKWQRWHDIYVDPPAAATGGTLDVKRGSFGFVGAPQPILADIEFDTKGNLILGFTDRFAHQQGWDNFIPGSAITRRLAVSHGDILLGYNTGAGYNFEGPNANDNHTVQPVPTVAQPALLLNDGPSGMGEFFYRDHYIGSDATHPETSLGGLMYLPGSDEITSIVFDPDAFNSQGVRWMDVNTGNQTRFYTAIGGTNITNFGKGAALGDVEALCSTAPLEVGNRVWNDLNSDGVQDPDEPALAGIEVTLWQDDGAGNFTQIASATTDANGNYYFSSATGTSSASAIFGLSDLLPNMNYELRFPTTTTVGPDMLAITVANSGGMDANADARDSDASSAGIVAFTTGGAGANNHTYDVGYRMPPCILPTTTLTTTPATCASGTEENNGSITVTSAAAATHYGISSAGAATYDGPMTIAAATAVPGALPAAILSNAPNAGATYIVRIFNGADDCFVDETVVVEETIVPTVEAGMPQTLCSTAQLSFLTLGASITPAPLGGMWTTSGDGQFLNGLGFVLSGDPFYLFGEVASYIPGPIDVMRGEVTLTLTTFNPDGSCDAVSDEVLITILKTDCGTFPWDGND